MKKEQRDLAGTTLEMALSLCVKKSRKGDFLNSTLVHTLFPLIFLLVVVLGTGLFLLWRRPEPGRRRRNNRKGAPPNEIPSPEGRHSATIPLKASKHAPQAELTQCPSCGTRFLYRKNSGTKTFCPNCESPYPNP